MREEEELRDVFGDGGRRGGGGTAEEEEGQRKRRRARHGLVGRQNIPVFSLLFFHGDYFFFLT